MSERIRIEFAFKKNGAAAWYAASTGGRAIHSSPKKISHVTKNAYSLAALFHVCQSAEKGATISCDQTYLTDGASKHLANWEKNGYKTSSKQPVANQDIWKRIAPIVREKELSFEYLPSDDVFSNSAREKALELVRHYALD